MTKQLNLTTNFSQVLGVSLITCLVLRIKNTLHLPLDRGHGDRTEPSSSFTPWPRVSPRSPHATVLRPCGHHYLLATTHALRASPWSAICLRPSPVGPVRSGESSATRAMSMVSSDDPLLREPCRLTLRQAPASEGAAERSSAGRRAPMGERGAMGGGGQCPSGRALGEAYEGGERRRYSTLKFCFLKIRIKMDLNSIFVCHFTE